MTFIANSFSINMLNPSCFTDGLGVEVEIHEISPEVLPNTLESAIGHEDLAEVVSRVAWRDIKAKRATISLCPGEMLYVAQYIGPRLAVGTTQLPEGAEVRFYRVEIRRPEAETGGLPYKWEQPVIGD